ncbi:MAG TPA: 50S ribosomal protein L4 [Candidatus Saccharimonadales bacterium]|nr:50S ribosomal protein L4 [Candidatus Saccharimonadales bacterium]
MVKVQAYSKTGTKQAEAVALDKAIFGVEANQQLVAQAYNAYLSNGRSAQPTTLTRGLVRGGGKKPWRQKGTGRARVGSIRVPNWRGGGVVFGPTGVENHIVQQPIKMKRAAIRQALSLKAAQDRIIIIEELNLTGKTKDAASLLAKLGATRRVLVVADDKTAKLDQALRNIPGVTLVQANYLNVFDVMNADSLIMTKKAIELIEQWLGEKAKAPKDQTEPTAQKPATKATPKPAPKAEKAK